MAAALPGACGSVGTVRWGSVDTHDMEYSPRVLYVYIRIMQGHQRSLSLPRLLFMPLRDWLVRQRDAELMRMELRSWGGG